MLSYEAIQHKGQRWERFPAAPYESWTLAADIGQAVDYTAISVLQHTRTPIERLGRGRDRPPDYAKGHRAF